MVGHRHAPVERGPCVRRVRHPPGHEADHLVAPPLGLDELGVGLVVRQQFVRIGRQPEEVRLLLGPRHGGPGLDGDSHTVGADGRFGLGEEAVVAHRGPAFVRVEVDVAGLVHPAPYLLGRVVVIGIGGADEPVEGDVEPFLHTLEHVGIAPRKLGGRNAFGCRRLGHLEPMYVGASQEAHVEPVESLEPRDRVGGDVFVGMPHVRVAVGIGDGCRDVIRLAHLSSAYCVAVSAKRPGRREKPPAPEPLTPLVDAHTHLDACGATDAASVTAIVDRAAAVGVQAVVTIADDLESARWVTEAADWDARVYAAVALHPTRANALTEEARTVIERLAEHPRVVAIGETGMDMYWPLRLEGCAEPADQREAFAWHIDLAKRTGKPLMIHNRDADAAVLDVLRAEGPPEIVIFHCFSSDAAMARTCVANGWLLSLSGTVSFRNASALREAAALIPSQQLLVETDAPFLTPHPFRGAPNEPYCLPYTVRALAEVLNRPAEDIARESTTTAVGAYGLPSCCP